jgi:hypothetical protein
MNQNKDTKAGKNNLPQLSLHMAAPKNVTGQSIGGGSRDNGMEVIGNHAWSPDGWQRGKNFPG